MPGNEEQAPETRSECPIVRTHRRFLLRQLEFTQQYASMYRCRVAAQQDSAIAAIKRVVAAEDGDAQNMPSEVLRVLEMKPGEPAFSVGVIYKQMKLLPRFLDEYQRELVRIDAGDDNDEDGGGEDDGAAVAEVAIAKCDEENAHGGDSALEGGQERAAADAHFSICHTQDELMLEDSSGRVTLHGLRATHFCTGVVIGIYGTLMPNGQVLVHRYAFPSIVTSRVPRPLRSQAKMQPCYIAFVCGLDVTLPENVVDSPAGNNVSLGGGGGVGAAAPKSPTNTSSAASHAALVRHRALLELLVDFIGGTTADPVLLGQARHISRLVIGGNSIAPTDEQKLKKKVKLDPSDHVRLSDDKASTGAVTSTKLMRELDVLLERLVASVEVELMPGDNDMSDAFQPQQPLHPVLLPNAARYSSLRLVTNPFSFTALVDGAKSEEEEAHVAKQAVPAASSSANGGGVSFFVTSGQNVNDVARETRFDSHLEAMGMILASGCACPTAPNTLFSYPFRETDPFLFHSHPDCFVACDQPQFETRYVHHDVLEKECSLFLDKESGKEEAAAEVKTEEGAAGTRIICVPSFHRSGSVVLVDVNSPTLETTRVTFALHGFEDQ